MKRRLGNGKREEISKEIKSKQDKLKMEQKVQKNTKIGKTKE